MNRASRGILPTHCSFYFIRCRNVSLNHRPFSMFLHLRLWGTSLIRFSKLSVVELAEKKKQIAPDELLATSSVFFFILVQYLAQWEIKRQIFAKLGFSTLQVNIKNFNHCDSKHLPACSQFNSEQSYVLFWYFDRIFVTYSTLGEQRPLHRQNSPKANWVNDSNWHRKLNGRYQIQQVYVKNVSHIRFQDLRKPRTLQLSPYR